MRRLALLVALMISTACLDDLGSGSSSAPAAAQRETSPSAQPNDRISKGLEITAGRAGLEEETGFVTILGEVHNKSEHWIESVRIDVDYLDAAGRSLAVDSVATAVAEDLGEQNALDFAYAETHYVPPGGVALFQRIRDVKNLGGTYASHRLKVSARIVPESEAPKVTVEDFSAHRTDDEEYLASGVIGNRGTLGCRSPEVIVGIYASDGTLYGVETGIPESYFQNVLAPGESVDVRFRFFDVDGDPNATLRAFADCSPLD